MSVGMVYEEECNVYQFLLIVTQELCNEIRQFIYNRLAN